jgi:hypothetical protein
LRQEIEGQSILLYPLVASEQQNKKSWVPHHPCRLELEIEIETDFIMTKILLSRESTPSILRPFDHRNSGKLNQIKRIKPPPTERAFLMPGPLGPSNPLSPPNADQA